jgi:S1-C subfamily serine protease
MRSRTELSRLAAALGGLPVLGCLDGSPAAEAGVRYGDVLLAIDGTPTASWDDYLLARGRCNGRFVARLFREGEELEIAVELRPTARTPLEALGELVARRVLDPAADEAGGSSDGDDGVN